MPPSPKVPPKISHRFLKQGRNGELPPRPYTHNQAGSALEINHHQSVPFTVEGTEFLERAGFAQGHASAIGDIITNTV